MLPAKSFSSFSQAVSEEKIFQKWTNEKHELPVAVMFVNGLGRNELYASYQVEVHLGKRFQMRQLKCEKLMDDGCQVMAKV